MANTKQKSNTKTVRVINISATYRLISVHGLASLDLFIYFYF